MLYLLFLVATLAFSQDPYKVAPNVYRMEFDNAWVRISRVTYQPGEKVALHDHPALPTVYIYLTDGGEIQFGHQEFYALRRRAVKAGQIRFNKGNRETHTTEYFGDQPSAYLRVELKTEPDPPAKDVRIAPEEQTAFESKQVRIERCAPCASVAVPSVVVSMKDGKARWVEAGGESGGEGEQIRVQLLSKPR